MRDEVDATGREIYEITFYDAAWLGCLNTLNNMLQQVHLPPEEYCYVWRPAARSGQLKELKSLRANGCPWNTMTRAGTARGEHLDALKRERGDVRVRSSGRTPPGAAVGAREEFPVSERDLRVKRENEKNAEH
jgi:hypothetical protein